MIFIDVQNNGVLHILPNNSAYNNSGNFRLTFDVSNYSGIVVLIIAAIEVMDKSPVYDLSEFHA